MIFFVEKNKIANYADDNTTYTVEKDITTLLTSLESDTEKYKKRYWNTEKRMKRERQISWMHL